MPRWLVGVDAGGTSTRAAAVSAAGGEVRLGRAEGANWTVHGPERCEERIRQAVRQALPPGAGAAAVCLCVAGYYPPDHAGQAEPWLRRAWPGVPARIVPDVVGAWAGAFGGDPGIVVISGTGSICYGRNRRAEEARAGGWGPLFGDAGSAYAVGVACLRALADRVDGLGEPTSLENRVRKRWPELAGEGEELRAWLRGVYRMQWGREQVAALAAEVSAAAEEGDPLASALIDDAGRDLARQTAAVHRALGGEPMPVALQGGMAASGPLVRSLQASLAGQAPGLEFVPSLLPPLGGAVLLAAEALEGRSGSLRLRESGALAAIADPG